MSNVQLNEDNVVIEGGFKLDFVFEVTNPYYTYDETYMDGNTPVLKWEGVDHDEPAEHTELISFGSNWEPVENGDYIKPTKGQRGINSGSTLGGIMSHVINKEYGEECFEKLAGKSLRRASTFKGTVWQMGGVEVDDLQNKDDKGKPKKKIKRMPVAFLGISKSAGGNWDYNEYLKSQGGAPVGNDQAGAPAGGGGDSAAELLARMQAASAGQVAAASAPSAASSTAAPANDVAAQQAAQMAALMAQAQAQAATQAAPPQTAPQAAAAPEFKWFKHLDQAKLKEFVDLAKKANDNNSFMVAAIGLDMQLTQKDQQLTTALLNGKVWEELKLLGAGL